MPTSILTTAEYTFTRPANTTAYAAGDQVNNNATAASVVPMSWTDVVPFGINRGAFRIIGARLRKSTTGVTNPSFRIHLYSAIPTVATAGDNATFANVTGAANWIGSLSATHTIAHADGCSIHALPSENAAASIPSFIFGTTALTIYGMIEATAAYAPGDSEVFGVRLIVEQYY